MKSIRNFLPSYVFVLLFLFSSTILFSQCYYYAGVKGNGNIVKQERKVESFNKLQVSSGIDVYLSQGEKIKIEVETDENIQKQIITEVVDNKLKIYVDGSIHNSGKLRVFVTAKDLSEIKGTSGSSVTTENQFKTNKMNLKFSSGCDAKLNFDVNELSCSVSSGSNIILKGQAVTFKAHSSSGSTLKAFDLKTVVSDVSSSSGSSIKVNVENELIAKASSGSSVVYVGEPKNIDRESSSGGSIYRK